MTCIAALRTRYGKIMMASERRDSYDFSQAIDCPLPKIKKHDNGMLMGATGCSSLCELFVDVLKPKPLNSNQSVSHYLHYTYYEQINKILHYKGYMSGKEDLVLKIPPNDSVELLIALKGELYTIDISNHDEVNDHPNGLVTITRLSLPFATGCGGQFSWGPIDVLKSPDIHIYDKDKKKYRKLTDKEILERAVKTANKYSPGCGGKIDFIIED